MDGYNLPRYKQNLHIEGNKVISYVTHVATIDRGAGKLYRHGYWSVTTSKHINYVADYYGLVIEDKERGEVSERSTDSSLKTIAMVAKLGEVLTDNQKASNDWKARMLKAGLENRGLIMPEDWAELSEDEKERRLNGAIAELAK